MRVLQRIVERHAILRTRFDLHSSAVPTKIVEPTATVEVTSTTRDLARPFDVEQAPLLRAALIPLSPDRFELALGFHHAILDGWSETILFREFATLYGDESTPLPPAPPYREFVELEHAADDPGAGH